jgi:PIN domain nuclease of toxin-antitoxin system
VKGEIFQRQFEKILMQLGGNTKSKTREEMEMKTILMSILALAISVAFVSGVMAQEKPTPAQATTTQMTKLEKFNGVVEKVDQATKDVLVRYHKENMTFSIGDHTKIVQGKKELPFTDLKKGMWASVQYKKEGNKLIADSMHVSMPKMQAKKETPSEKATSSEKTPEKK